MQVDCDGFTRGSDGLFRKITRESEGRREQIVRNEAGKIIGVQHMEWSKKRGTVRCVSTWDGKYEHVA